MRDTTSEISSSRKPAEPACGKSRWAEAGSSTAFPTNAKTLLLPCFQGSHSKANSFQGGFIRISPINSRKLSIGNEGCCCCCCYSVNLPEEGEREKGTRQCNIVPGEREIQALSAGIHPGWAASTVMIKPYSFLTSHAEPSSSQH